VRGAILAGGNASRFGGRPKGLERVGGERILDRVAAALGPAVDSPPLLVANAPEAGAWLPGHPTAKDVIPHCGSLGGIYTAVSAGEGPVLVVGWDLPFLPVALLETLAAEAEGCDVFLPESDGPLGMEPVCGVYGEGAVPAIRASLDRKDFRTTAFHEQVTVGRLGLERVRALGDPQELFFNINAPDDLVEAEERWRRRAASA
jgi:molybdopterin-guanine dinucleotide biosynthesis protein A